MGLPYSKQIYAAFDEVTPLVAEGFQVLQTTKNISICLAVVQVLTVVFLALILVTLLGLLIAINPDMEHERQELVTPVMKWMAECIIVLDHWKKTVVVLMLVVAVGCVVGGLGGIWYTARDQTMTDQVGEGMQGGDSNEINGEDLEAIKQGQSKQ
ncbi:hypothetical protein PMZ80_000630 [Knufia obscura]|uniref:Uncharacterized protein n=2 Tax=Knufia TaxID=430999 RepID=A0AAN8I1A5_9EURO|nr:hypothetical protein PMZ80_000630 [Knufia obscura]KAK5948512.1 hypothetical protein OHC33_010408 [Knufia fluminis]